MVAKAIECTRRERRSRGTKNNSQAKSYTLFFPKAYPVLTINSNTEEEVKNLFKCMKHGKKN